jgi:PA14 domain.
LDHLPVSITTKIPGATIRFTTNGDEPSLKSPVVPGKLVMDNTATIKAKCFLGNKPVSQTAVAEFQKVKPSPTVTVTSMTTGVKYWIYDGDWNKLPSFDTVKVTAEGIEDHFDIRPRKNTERFGFVFQGMIKVPYDAIYTFYTTSDDGSQLFIDDKLIVDNDGLHGPIEKSGQAPLAKGFHKIRVTFFERTGGDELKVEWESARMKKQEIPSGVLSH